MMIFQLLINFLITLFLCIGFTSPAQAERVFIERSNKKGEQGQGWLFGAKNRAGDMICWVALPTHVAGWRKGFGNQSLEAFSFQTSKRKQGISGRPLSVHQNERARGLLGSDLDLAFAPVVSGFRNGECMSRLGLPPLVYDFVSTKKLIVDTVNISNKRFDLFQMSLRRGGLGKNNFVQIFELTSMKDKVYLKGGLSGGVVTFPYQGHSHPYAMITAVNTANSTVQGIRFDAIMKAFGPIRTSINAANGSSVESGGSSLPYRIVDYEGKFDPAHAAPELLSQSDTCWKMVPAGGQRMVRLSVEPDNHVPISAISFRRTPTCGLDAIQIGVDVSYDEGQSWVRISDCPFRKGEVETECRLNLSQARSLRVTAIGRVFSLSEMRLLP